MVRVQVFLQVLFRPHRLAWPRTLPFQGSNTGSNPVGDTSKALNEATRAAFQRSCLQEIVADLSSYNFGGVHVYDLSSP